MNKPGDGIPLRFLGDLQRIQYHEGDVFVLFASTFLRGDAVVAIRNQWEAVMPGSRIIILQGDVKLAVITKEQLNGLQ